MASLMDRFFASDIADNIIKLDDEDVHHLLNVMRHRQGDLFEAVFAHRLYQARITSVSPFTAVSEKEIMLAETKRPKLTLIYCLPKKDKLEFVVQKATELGVDEIILTESKNAVVKWTKEEAAAKMERLRKIAKEASQQAKRTTIPVIDRFVTFKEALALPFALKLIADEHHAGQKMFDIPKKIGQSGNIAVLIGSEGGFKPEETEASHSAGFTSVSLGRHILRTETAPVVALAVLNYIIGSETSE